MVRLALITSVRELVDRDHVGRPVRDSETGRLLPRRRGLVEVLAEALAVGTEGAFARRFRLAALLTDDAEEDWRRAWRDTGPWDPGLRLQPAIDAAPPPTLGEITVRIPSRPWRVLRGAGKIAAKAAYERRVLAALQAAGVDLVVSDAHVTIFGPVLLEALGRRDDRASRLWNVHPGITAPDDPARLPGLNPTRDAVTRLRHGWMIVDDNRYVTPPPDALRTVTWEGRERLAMDVPTEVQRRHGVTIHEVTEVVDAGRVVATHEWSLPEDATYEGIRQEVHRVKPRLLMEALLALSRPPHPREDGAAHDGPAA